jgi:Spy/CpxP family protein refolding chaperone
MSLSAEPKRPIFLALLFATCLSSGAAVAEGQDRGPGQHGAMHGAMHGASHGAGMQRGREGQPGKGGHGGHGAQHGAGHSGKGGHARARLYSAHWKTTLDETQKQALDRLHVDYARVKHPAKARRQALEMELRALATASQPNQAAIGAKLDQLLAVQRELMQAKYAYLVGQRQILNPEQRLSFDMELLHPDQGRGGDHH